MKLIDKHSNGFTLTEVLATISVLSFGLLGIAGRVSLSMRNISTLMLRTQGRLITYKFAYRVHSNTAAIAKGGDSDIASANSYNCNSGCNVSEMAASDIYLFEKRVTDPFPSGSAVLIRKGRRLSVEFSWNDDLRRQEMTTFTLGFSV